MHEASFLKSHAVHHMILCMHLVMGQLALAGCCLASLCLLSAAGTRFKAKSVALEHNSCMVLQTR